MLSINYVLVSFDGDYAVLVDEKNNENKVAIALLPDGIRVGSKILFENFEYSLV